MQILDEDFNKAENKFKNVEVIPKPKTWFNYLYCILSKLPTLYIISIINILNKCKYLIIYLRIHRQFVNKTTINSSGGVTS